MPAVNIKSDGTTETLPLSLSTGNMAPGRVAPSPKILAHKDEHAQPLERLFIGPMPSSTAERSINAKGPNSPQKHWWLTLRDRSGDQNDDNVDEDEVPEGHAFRYFLKRGGREEDWGSQESLRKGVKREMLRQWRQSGWASLRYKKKGQTQPRKWIGQTFKIGDDFLGLPLQTDAEVLQTNLAESLPRPGSSSSYEVPASTSRNLSAQSYHTALEVASERSSGESSTPSTSNGFNKRGSKSNGSDVALIPSPEASPSRKAVPRPKLLSSPSLSRKAHTDGQIRHTKTLLADGDASRTIASENAIPSSHKSRPLRSAFQRLREDRGSKTVQFSAVPQVQVEPVPPSEVLARPSNHDPETSAGAAQLQDHGGDIQGDNLRYGDVVRRARMLVRRSNVKSGNIAKYFDEGEAIKVRDLRSYEWKEFLVVWRKEQLELYEDYSIPGKETLLGHKHLACVIPLQKPNTRLSLYSFTDLTFCLTCTMLHVPKDKIRTASSLSARIPFRQSMGVDVFVFKTKTRTLGTDWMWELWRQLGNEIPRTFEVHCPVIETRIRLQVPEFDATGGEGYKVFTRDHVIDLCLKALRNLQAWDYLVEEPVRQGAHLELCWRKESILDWVRWGTDADGMTRPWAVLYGLCLGKPRAITHLEIRVGEHRSTAVALSDGTHLREPPSVEGYLYRIKPNSQSRAQVYLSSHAGCLFTIHPSRAQPPRPPIPITDDAQAIEDVDKGNKILPFSDREIQRGMQQVLLADAFVDLRSILVVRRAFQLIVPPRHLESLQGGENDQHGTVRSVVSDEEEDQGGDEVLARHSNKPALKMRRSFELLMRTGHVVRFETYSCRVAQEWVEHLTRLIKYWTHRHRLDASQEMELIHAIMGKPGLVTAKPNEHAMPERPLDYDQSSELLPSFWNLCVVDGCLSVMRNGRLFLRRGLRGQYRLMQLVLVSGHLIQFHITSHAASHHLRSQTISLLDAYVCSGHFATQSLPIDEFSANQDPLPRRFQDGLENEDHELDTVFLIWYRPHPIAKADGKAYEPTIPPLKAKHRVLVLKSRSKLERDAWCSALNAEIERLSRRTSDREAQARDGGLAKVQVR